MAKDSPVTPPRLARRTPLSYCLIALLVLGAPIASAGPLVIEEVAKITSPEPDFAFGAPFGSGVSRVAIDGDFMLVSGTRQIPDTLDEEQAVFLFRRASNGTWAYVRKIASSIENRSDFSRDKPVAMRDGIAAIGGLTPQIFERSGNDYVLVTQLPFINGADIEIHSGTVLFSESNGTWDARALRRNASGQWTEAGRVTGDISGGDDEQTGRDVDIWGTSLIVANPNRNQLEFTVGHARAYLGPIGSWTELRVESPFEPNNPANLFGSPVTMTDEVLVVGDAPWHGLTAQQLGLFDLDTGIGIPERFAAGAVGEIDFTDDRLLLVGYSFDSLRGLSNGSVAVLRRNPDGSFTQIARLVGSDGSIRLGASFAISGRRVAVTGANAVYVFELPTDFSQPARRMDDFEDGSAADWTPTAGSNFQVVTRPFSRVYRQSSLVGGAASYLNDTDWTNQAIEAFIVPAAFDGPDRWFGLAVRRNGDNYYYVTARSSNVLQLKRQVNGVVTTLATISLPMVINRGYRLRLEATGSRIRVFHDGALRLDATDQSLTRGQAGIIMFKTRAEYDNVLVSPNPHVVLMEDNFEQFIHNTRNWTPGPLSQWNVVRDGSRVFSQTSIADNAVAVTGAPTGDQIVQARARATTFAAGGDRWFGLMARRRDERNYYYVTVRQSNQIMLRKLVNGTPVTLDTAPLTVNVGTWYTLRLEAIGNVLRGYVNGQLLLEATDSDHAEGTYGPVMFKTAANYDDFFARQP